MIQTICKIGPLTISEYGVIIAIIAGVSLLTIIGIALTRGNNSKAISTVLFWTLILAVVSMIPLLMPITIYSYGLMLAIAVVAVTFTLSSDARRINISQNIILDLMFWAVIGGIIGARLFYLLLNFPYFIEHIDEIVKIQNGGLAWQGGLIVGFITVVLYIKSRQLSLLKILDLTAPYLALGQSIGRIGCFLNGCCYGREIPWGIYFPIHNANLHPTQLYLCAGYLLIFIILKRYQRFSGISGLVFALYLILASTLRFGVEFFRADHEIIFLGLSIFQLVAFGVLIFAFSFAVIALIKHSADEKTLT